MKECAACGREFQDDVQFCPIDGQPLDMKQPAAYDPSAARDPLVGTVLDDKYRLDKKIGEGGMGAVYRATHIHMDSAFAVKLLHRSMVADQQAVERFRREARAAARIRHANAVSVTDFGVTKEGTVYLVMEYLEGGDLRDKLRKVRVMSPTDTVRIMMQTCAAIEEAHRKGIVHRDLKPDNIWLLTHEASHEEQVKVLDFGIAKLKTQGPSASNLTQQGMIVGTPHYMSPEQCRGEELDARSDLYSLGIIVYEMLTGDVPFRAPTPVGVVLKHANEQPTPLRQVNPNAPEPLERVVMKALAKNREQRQRSASEFARELAEALRLSGELPLDLAQGGFPSTGDFGRVPSTGARTAPETDPPSQDKRGTHAQDPHKTARVGGGATVAMTSAQAGVGTASPDALAGATKVMASGMATSSTSKPRDSVATPPTSVAIPAKSNMSLYIALAAVAVVAVVAAIWWVTRAPAADVNANANARTNGGGGGTVVTPSGPPQGMVLVKGAAFKMGTDDPSAGPEDKPAHEKTVGDFYMDQNEVTNELYQQFVRQAGHEPPPHWNGKDYPPGEGNFPVVNVSWFDAKAYAEWAGKRLPTEAEWEFAARGTDGRVYPWGAAWSPQLSNSKEDGRNQAMAVGSYPRGVSPFQVFDMAGNVAEWVADDYEPYPGSQAPPDPGFKSYRGGAYSADRERLKATYRWYDKPTAKWPYLGFRCAKDAGN